MDLGQYGSRFWRLQARVQKEEKTKKHKEENKKKKTKKQNETRKEETKKIKQETVIKISICCLDKFVVIYFFPFVCVSKSPYIDNINNSIWKTIVNIQFLFHF